MHDHGLGFGSLFHASISFFLTFRRGENFPQLSENTLNLKIQPNQEIFLQNRDISWQSAGSQRAKQRPTPACRTVTPSIHITSKKSLSFSKTWKIPCHMLSRTFSGQASTFLFEKRANLRAFSRSRSHQHPREDAL